MEFKMQMPNKHVVTISAWEWNNVACEWIPCFKNKSVYLATRDPLSFNHCIAVTKEEAREIWCHYRKEKWVQ
jgi:hypothetical protein